MTLSKHTSLEIKSRDDHEKRNDIINMREHVLSFLSLVIPKKSKNLDDLEQSMLERSKVTEITGLFDINAVEYCKLILKN